MSTGKPSIGTDFDGIYNTIPKRGMLDLRRRHFGKGTGEPEMDRQELMAAARAGNEWAKGILRRDYSLTRWVSEGEVII